MVILESSLRLHVNLRIAMLARQRNNILATLAADPHPNPPRIRAHEDRAIHYKAAKSAKALGHADGIETRAQGDWLLKLSHEVRPLGAELRPLRDELRLLGVGARLHGTKDKPHRSEARARRLDHDNGVETRSMGKG
ncbi:hypothetical protein Tco_0927631 [Tanacetum coccineum]